MSKTGSTSFHMNCLNTIIASSIVIQRTMTYNAYTLVETFFRFLTGIADAASANSYFSYCFAIVKRRW